MKLSSAQQVGSRIGALLVPCLMVAAIAGCGGDSPVSPQPTVSSGGLLVASPAGFPTINALPVGSLFIQDLDSLNEFYRVDPSTGAMSPLPIPPNQCIMSWATATGPDGIGISQRNNGVSQIDPVTAHCRPLFAAPAYLSALAVAADGSYVAQDYEDKPSIYRFSSSGSVLSRVPLSGAASMKGFAYASNGRLYGLGLAAPNDRRWYELDPVTGAATQIATGVRGGEWGGVCIDAAGTAYTLEYQSTGSVLHKYEPITGASRGSLTLNMPIGGWMLCR